MTGKPDVLQSVGLQRVVHNNLKTEQQQMVLLVLVFEKPPNCFPQWLSLVTVPSTVYEGSLFSIFSPTFVTCVLFDDSHSPKCEIISQFSFDLHFPDDLCVMLSIFSCSHFHLHFLFGKMSIQFVYLFFSWVVCFFDIELYELFMYVGH